MTWTEKICRITSAIKLVGLFVYLQLSKGKGAVCAVLMICSSNYLIMCGYKGTPPEPCLRVREGAMGCLYTGP